MNDNPQAHLSGAPMPSIVDQAVAASGIGNGPSLVVNATGDLAAKGDVAQDSFFLISHLTSGSDTLDLMVHYIRLTPLDGKSFVQAIVSVLDPVTGQYLAQEQVVPADQAFIASDRFDLQTPFGGMSGTAEAMRVSANFPNISVDLALAHRGPLLANLGTGLLPFAGDINYHYALPSMATTGTATINGKRYDVTGTSWFDRQWGNIAPRFWKARQWSWMGISLDNGDRISLWDILDGTRENVFATVLHPDGRHEIVAVEPLANGATLPWTSPATGHVYPTRWSVSIPSLNATFDVRPRLREQEIVSPIGAHKYEAASDVIGEMLGQPIKGHAVVELVGDWK